jgi:hypothetical protein
MCIEDSRVERLPHLTYRPDLAPSIFFLLGDVKGKRLDHTCEIREDLLNAIIEIFTGVNQSDLPHVFESWVNRLKWVIKHEGKYSTEQRKTRDTSSRLADKTGGYDLMDRPIYIHH